MGDWITIVVEIKGGTLCAIFADRPLKADVIVVEHDVAEVADGGATDLWSLGVDEERALALRAQALGDVVRKNARG